MTANGGDWIVSFSNFNELRAISEGKEGMGLGRPCPHFSKAYREKNSGAQGTGEETQAESSGALEFAVSTQGPERFSDTNLS